MNVRRVLVLTVVHHPEDARIRQRQIPALLAADCEVTYVAPWTGYGLEPPEDTIPRLTPVDVTRACGRSRLRAHWSARRVLRRLGPLHDVVLLHDPELVPLTVGLTLPPVVWDVHEDTPATISIRTWIPRLARPALRSGVAMMERWAEERLDVVLADHHYAHRFQRQHPVVPNSTPVPPVAGPAGRPEADGRQRIVYLGSVTRERGSLELVELGRRLRREAGDRVFLQVIGPAHGPASADMELAHQEGHVVWTGFLPSPRALELVDGALAGLSPLHDAANFRPSMPTKIVEYLAHGVPVITTPLPMAVDLVRRSGAGVVVPFNDVDRTFDQVMTWLQDPGLAAELGRKGHALVRQELDWAVQGPEFAQVIRAVASRSRSSR